MRDAGAIKRAEGTRGDLSVASSESPTLDGISDVELPVGFGAFSSSATMCRMPNFVLLGWFASNRDPSSAFDLQRGSVSRIDSERQVEESTSAAEQYSLWTAAAEFSHTND